MIGTVVVSTVGKGNGQSVGVMVRHHQVVRSCLGSRVRTSGVIGSVFSEITCFSQGTVYFVGGNVVEQHVISHGTVLCPIPSGSFQQGKCSRYIGFYKGFRPQNRTIHMAFCRKMNYCVDIVVLKNMCYFF